MTLRDDIAELKRLEAMATPGEWDVGVNRIQQPLIVNSAGATIAKAHAGWVTHSEFVANTAFIATARNTLPRLIAQIERMERALNQLVERDLTYYDYSVRLWFLKTGDGMAAVQIARAALKSMDE